MAFSGRDNNGTIFSIVNGKGTFDEDISPRNVASSGQITVPEGRLLPLTVQEADGSPLNTETFSLIFPNASLLSSGNQVQVVFPTAESGLITGPTGLVTDNALVRWDGTSGAVIQNSNATLTDAGDLTLTGDISADAGTFTGDIQGANITATGDLTAVGGTFSGAVQAASLDSTGDITASGDLTADDVNANRVLLPQTTVTGVYTEIQDTEYFVRSNGASTLVLPPSPVVGQVHVVKDVAGTAGGSPVTIAASGSTVDGLASIDLTNNFEAISFIWNGTGWDLF